MSPLCLELTCCCVLSTGQLLLRLCMAMPCIMVCLAKDELERRVCERPLPLHCTLIQALSHLCPCLQLGGIASLQAICKDDLHLAENDINDIAAELTAAQKLLVSFAANPTAATAVPTLLAVDKNMLLVLQALAYRSTAVFTLTPDIACSAFYRCAALFALCCA